MGWKAACIITGDCPDAYLGESLQHHPEKATEILERIGYNKPISREDSTFEPYPKSGTYMVGAYDKAIFLADQEIIFDCFENRDHPYFKKVLDLYPQGKLLMFVLQSVINYFGYAYYENGKLVREFSGNSDDGVISDFGELQPEEKEIFANSKLVDGKRIFSYDIAGTIEEFEVDGMGDSLVFLMVGRYFGQPLDQTLEGHRNNFELPTELFTGVHPSKKAAKPHPGSERIETVIKSIANSILSKLKK
ncbi:hypothetical protein BH11CYA1_BH11CYA1_41560 [soil metagenome]